MEISPSVSLFPHLALITIGATRFAIENFPFDNPMSDFKTYDAYGLFFAYPSNWELEETDMIEVEGAILLSSPEGAFWILRKYPLETEVDAIVDSVVETMRVDYQDMEIQPQEKTLFGKTLRGAEMTFFYLDLMNTASVLCYSDELTTYAVFWQTGNQLIVQDEGPVALEDVFGAITYSLLRGEV